jgi:hypothetical protein
LQVLLLFSLYSALAYARGLYYSEEIPDPCPPTLGLIDPNPSNWTGYHDLNNLKAQPWNLATYAVALPYSLVGEYRHSPKI